MAQHLISQDYIKQKSVIDNNVDFSKLAPIIELVQEVYMRPALGSDLYDQIITQSTPSSSLTAANQYLMDNFIQTIMVYYLQSRAALSVHYRFTNKGIVTRTAADENGIDAVNLKMYMQEWKTDAETMVQRMKDYIIAHPSDYPAFFTNNGIDRIIPNYNSFNIDMYLRDVPATGLTNDTGPLRQGDSEHSQPF